MSHTADLIDLTDARIFEDRAHYEVFSYLREHSPVFWNQARRHQGFWAVTRYDDVYACYVNHQGLTSTVGPILGGSYESADTDTAANKMLVASDLPRHRMLRKLVRITTSAAYVDRARMETRNLLVAALDKVEREGGGSVSEDLSLCLPMGALMAIFGISPSRARELIAMTRSMIGIEDPFYGGSLNGDELRLSSIHADMLGFFDDELEYRRDNPDDDFITYLLNAKADGHTLTDEEILFNCMNLAVGGNETSSYTASTGVFLFSEHKSAYNTLVERPD